MLMYLILAAGLAAGAAATWHPSPRIRGQAVRVAVAVTFVALWHWGEW